MTADQAFDRVEVVRIAEICGGDVITVDSTMVPKEVEFIESKGSITQINFVDHTYRLVNSDSQVKLYMD